MVTTAVLDAQAQGGNLGHLAAHPAVHLDIDARRAIEPSGGNPAFSQRIDHRLLHARHQFANLDAPPRQIKQQVNHHLPGPVIGNLSATIDLDQRNAVIDQQMLRLASLPQRVSTPDLYLPLDNTDVTDLMAAFEAEAVQLSDAKISTIDGIRLDFDAGFGIIRPSNTGHFITARFDADTAENLRLIRATFARLLRSKDERLAQLILE